ncbi:MAG: SUMF1/EgtB/PvdO family nonheme iron enzyme [Bacteroidota bacterium]
MRVKTRIYAGGLLLLGMLVMPALSGQSVYVNMGKGWSYITGAQRAVNDSNRVNYLLGGTLSADGLRVNNFNDMEPYYKDDSGLLSRNWYYQDNSEFLDAHLSAAEVYEASKTVDGPAFFISQTEVSNLEYRKFVESCIAKWMKENRPEIAQKYKWESPEYVQAVQAWLESSSATDAAVGAVSSTTVQAPAKNWAELYMQNLDWGKITFRGESIFPNTQVWISRVLWNESLRVYYFGHPFYNNYPVVGVSYLQATLYCQWYSDAYGQKEREEYQIEYRLPSELEWERAASVVAEKRSKKSSGSPVNNNFLRNSKGAYIANFRDSVEVFMRDKVSVTEPVQSFWTNDAGCYNMQGNVAEWTSTEIDYRVGEYTEEGHIIKGGAWNLPAAACTIGSRGIIYYGVAGEEPATSYVGFRMVAVPMKKFRPLITPEF